MARKRVAFDLAAAVAAGEATIALPRGRHVLKAKLVVRRKLTIRGAGTIEGAGIGAVIEVAKGGELVLDGVTVTRTAKPGSVIVCRGKLTARRCKISGGRDSDAKSNAGAGIVAYGSGKLTVENCDVTACWVAMQVDERSIGRFIANRATGTSIGIAATGHGTCTAIRNRLQGNLNAFNVSDDTRVVIEGNTCERSGMLSIAIDGRCEATVRNNTVRAAKRDGISVNGRAVVTIERNKVSDCKWCGISLVGGNSQVRGNTVERSTWQGVWIAAKAKARVTGNECMRNKLSGIAVAGSATPEVANNRCHHNKMAGVLVLGKSRPHCVNNTLEDNGRAGIEIYEQAFATMQCNQIRRNDIGIFVLGRSGARLDRDQVIDNAFGIEIGDRAKAELEGVVVEESENVGVMVWSAAKLASCRIAYNEGAGLRVEKAARVETRKCQIFENYAGAIEIAERASGTFDGDYIGANRGYGIVIEGSATPTVRRARIEGNERSGIYVQERAKPRLEHNTCGHNGEEGIRYGDKAAGIARGNTCTKNEGSGFRLVGGVSPTLVDNICTKNDDRGIALDEDIHDVAPKATLRNNTTKGNGSEDGIGTRITLRGALAKLRGKPKKHLRPAFVPTLADGDTGNASKLGGTPWLAKGEAWPVCGNCARAMPLFLQLDLDKVPAAVRGRFGGGLLQFFHCTNETSNCHEVPTAHVLRRIAKRGTTQGAPLRGGFPARRITGWREHAEVTRWLELRSPYIRKFAAAIAEAGCSYNDGDETIGSGPDVSPELGDKLFGWPCWIQDPGKSRGCPRCKSRHELLFQIDSEHGVPWMWGDSGVAFILQCPKHPDELIFDWQCF